MTGMKEGAGDDPFADDPDNSQSNESNEISVDSEQDQQTSSNGRLSRDESVHRERQQIPIPYKFRRDSVQDGRNRVPLFVHPETQRDEREAQRTLEDRFDEDVSLTDLREALTMVGLNHLDEVEAQLEEWGYGMTFEK